MARELVVETSVKGFADPLTARVRLEGFEDPLTALEELQVFEAPVFMEASFHGIRRRLATNTQPSK